MRRDCQIKKSTRQAIRLGAFAILAASCFLFPATSQAAAMRTAQAEAVLRLEGPIANPKLQGQNKYLAFTEIDGRSLRILDLSNNEVVEISSDLIGPAYFWSPDGARLFYRAIFGKDGSIVSELRAYDVKLNKTVELGHVAGLSGYPTFDPRAMKILMMHEKGIHSRQLEFPGERPSAWQKTKKPYDGNWIATQKGMLWLSDRGLSLKKLVDDGSGIESFTVSPDGQMVAWATKAGTIFTATAPKAEAIMLEAGRDPAWHPDRPLLAYVASRQIGSKVYDYDIKISDLKSPARFVRTTPDLAERWPLWLGADTLIFTADRTTDLFRMRFALPEPIAIKVQEPGRLQ